MPRLQPPFRVTTIVQPPGTVERLEAENAELRRENERLRSQVNMYRTAAGVLAGWLIYATRRFREELATSHRQERAGEWPEDGGHE